MPILNPFSPEEKRRILIRDGYDPERFDISDDTFDVIPKPVATVVPSSPVTAKPEPSAARAFGGNVVTGLGPAAAGLAAGAKAAAVVGGISSPSGPFAAIPAAIAGLGVGIGTSVATAYAQKKLAEATGIGDQFIRETEEATAAHPVAGLAGNIVAQGPFMRPSPTMLKDAAKAFMQHTLKGGVSSVLRSPAGADMVLGTAVGAGSGLYDEITDPADFNAGRMALNVAAGALMNKPTALSTKFLGVKPYATPTGNLLHEGTVIDPRIAQQPVQTKPRFEVDATGRAADTTQPVVTEPMMPGVRTPEEAAALDGVLQESIKKAVNEKMAQAQLGAVRDMAINELKAKGIGADVPVAPEQRPKPLYTKSGPDKGRDAVYASELRVNKMEQVEGDDLAVRQLEADLAGEPRPKYQEAEQAPTGRVYTEEEIKAHNEFNAARDKAKARNHAEAKLEEARLKLEKEKIEFQRAQLKLDQKRLKEGNVSEMGTLPPAKPSVTAKPAGMSLRAFNEARAAQHQGIDFAYEPGDAMVMPDGTRVTGYQEGNTIRATERRADTVPHEFQHKGWESVPQGDKTRLIEMIKKHKKAQDWIADERKAGREPGKSSGITPEEEWLAQKVGERDVERLFKTQPSFRRDFKAWYNNVIKKQSTMEEALDWLVNSFSYGHTKAKGVSGGSPRVLSTESQGEATPKQESPFQDYYDKSGTKPMTPEERAAQVEASRQKDMQGARYKSGARYQTEEQAGTTEYNNAQAKLKSLMANKQFDGPEFQAAWAENERVKNTYFGGHTPEGWSKQGGKPKLQPANQSNTTGELPPNLYLEAPLVLEDSRKLGLGSAPIAGEVLWNRVSNLVSPLEKELIEKAGVKEWLAGKGKVTPAELGKWIQENGPKVEVVNYGMEGKVSEAKKEYDRMTHEWADTLTQAQRIQLANEDVRMLPQEQWEKARKYIELKRDVENEPRDTSPRATSAYSSVSALDTTQPMPEWTATRSGKNVQRVDVVIPPRLNADKVEAKLREQGYSEEAIKEILQFDKINSERNNLAGISDEVERPLWQQDNLHENLPNTLGWAMLQYKTGPRGEKIAVIAEAQSRWGQKLREERREIRAGTVCAG